MNLEVQQHPGEGLTSGPEGHEFGHVGRVGNPGPTDRQMVREHLTEDHDGAGPRAVRVGVILPQRPVHEGGLGLRDIQSGTEDNAVAHGGGVALGGKPVDDPVVGLAQRERALERRVGVP